MGKSRDGKLTGDEKWNKGKKANRQFPALLEKMKKVRSGEMITPNDGTIDLDLLFQGSGVRFLELRSVRGRKNRRNIQVKVEEAISK